jgi:hypothetical protein
MAKKKMTSPTKSDTSGMSLADFKANYTTAAPSSASVGIAGKTYTAPGTSKAYVGPNYTKDSKVKTAGKGFAGSGTPLGTSIAGSNLSKGNVAKTIIKTATAASGIKAMSSLKLVRSVPEAAKGLQRALSSELKSQSTKGMSKLQREAVGEYNSELLPSESSRLTQSDLQKQISEVMKTNKGPLKIIKKK